MRRKGIRSWSPHLKYIVYIQGQPSDSVFARLFGKGRRSWTSFGNPYRPLMDDKSSSIKMEGGFDVQRNDYTLSWRGGLLSRAIGGIDKIPAPDTVAGRLLSNASLLVSAPFRSWRDLYLAFEWWRTEAHSSSPESLSLELLLVQSMTSSLMGCFPLALSMGLQTNIWRMMEEFWI